MSFSQFLIDNKVVSEMGIKHAEDFSKRTNSTVNERYRDVPNVLLLISAINENRLVKCMNEYLNKVEYHSTADYEKEPNLFKVLTFEEMLNLECVVLKINPHARKLVLGTISKTENNIVRAKTIINKALPTYSVESVKIFPVPYLQWIKDSQTMKGVEFEPQELRITVDENMKTIFRLAVERGATDISIESEKTETKVFLTIDKLRRQFEYKTFTPDEAKEVTNWILTTGGVPQIHIESKEVDCALPHLGYIDSHRARVNKMTSYYGVTINMRILPNNPKFIDLGTLNYSSEVYEYVRYIAKDRKGLVLIVGPTNSGKNTTIFAILSEMYQKYSKKFISIEDPVEYVVPGVNQIEASTTEEYRSIARAVVRQSPDILYLSEIRDDITMESALTLANQGKYVISTMHVSYAYQILSRSEDLIQKDISSKLVSELIGVVNQVLIPKACPKCIKEVKKADIDDKYATILDDKGYVGKIFINTCKNELNQECSYCEGQGTKGIVPVAEFINFDNQLKGELRKARYIHEKEEILFQKITRDENTLLDDALRHMALGHLNMDTLTETALVHEDFKTGG